VNSKILFNILFYVFAIILAIYFTVSIFSSSVFTQTISSSIVEVSPVDVYIVIDGIALRNETLLMADSSFQSIRYLPEDGSRIAKNSIYAYYNEQGISNDQTVKLAALNRKMTRLNDTIGKSTQYDIFTVEQNIKESIISYLNRSYADEFSVSSKEFEQVQSAFDQRLLQQEGPAYIKDVVKSLKSEISQIYSESGLSEKILYAPSAGYFYSKADGYEYINMNDYETPTVSSFRTLMEQKQENISNLCVGKIQHYSYWAFLSLVPSEYVSDLYVGKTVYLEFTIPDVGSKKISTTVEYISRAQDGQNVVRFRCGTLTADLFGLRKESPHMILKTYTGLEVNNEALRVVDGQTGVYVISAQRIIFKPVDVVYVSDEFSLVSSKANTGDRVLKAKDEIIIGGKDLFDGKIVNVTKYD